MKLDKTLNFKKVRCVKGYDDCLKIGKEYGVIDTRMEVKARDDEGDFLYWKSGYFEPVLGAAENPLQGAEPKFKVGDKVYKYGEADVKTVLEVFKDGYMRISNYPHRVNHEVLCYATPENHAMLSKPYPRIEFEQPSKEITGSDLTKGMFERGDLAVVCKCSNISEYSAIAESPLRLIIEYSKGCFLDNTGHSWEYAVPCDPKTGEPLRS